jgi:hypothetical protein
MLSLITLLMNLVLLGAYERAFVNVGVDLNVGVVAQLESVLNQVSVSLVPAG